MSLLANNYVHAFQGNWADITGEGSRNTELNFAVQVTWCGRILLFLVGAPAGNHITHKFPSFLLYQLTASPKVAWSWSLRLLGAWNSRGMVPDLCMGFRAKLGDNWSLCNHVGPSIKHHP